MAETTTRYKGSCILVSLSFPFTRSRSLPVHLGDVVVSTVEEVHANEKGRTVVDVRLLVGHFQDKHR